jgi:cyclophilin family peptidyl-prolyl cis-trans isomerase
MKFVKVVVGTLALATGLIVQVGRAEEKAVKKGPKPTIVMETSEGAITVELWPQKAPVTVKNFLRYAQEGFYDGTLFHRVIDGFMIQGGGFSPDMKEKPAHETIINEAARKLKNERGTIAMARTNKIHSATSQFFINLKDNTFLDHVDDTPRGFGYAVFGKVVAGMEVVDRIGKVKTTTLGRYRDVPAKAVTIRQVRLLKE